MPSPASKIIHASAIAYGGRGLLILGPSGSGKSALALRLMAYGAGLVSDDRTLLSRGPGGGLEASCPAPAIRGLIEARGIAILRATPHPPVPLMLAVDLGGGPDGAERLPPPRRISFLKIALPLVLSPLKDHLAEALLQWLSGGGPASTDEWASG